MRKFLTSIVVAEHSSLFIVFGTAVTFYFRNMFLLLIALPFSLYIAHTV